ncbi:MAG: archaetidylserine decarboxylase [Burkholderiaceae bacterium]
MSDRLHALIQHALPKQAMTRLAHVVANARWGGLTQWIIRDFVRRYSVNMSEAQQPDLTHYRCFNDFFTRALRPGARPLALADLVCPVDGAISQCGAIDGNQIFQAKGHTYSAAALLGGDADLAAQFASGSFATIYLSPKDYHRIHMPMAARLLGMVHVPGQLFSVNPATARSIPGLFARNERVVCVFESDFGSQGKRPWALVLVGAAIVGSMATVWHGQVNPPRPGQLRQWNYAAQAITLGQGDEMGRFLLGSTVVLLFPPGMVQLNPQWAAGLPVRLNEVMGTLSASGARRNPLPGQEAAHPA